MNQTQMLEELETDYLARGSRAILDRAFDSQFMEAFGLRQDKYRFSRVEQLLTAYEESVK